MADEKTYVRIPKTILQDRENQWSAFRESDVEELLLQYAKKQSTNNGLVKDGKICRHKAIKHLKKEVKKTTDKLGIVEGWESMSLYVSIRQIEKLLSSLKSNERLCLTGFSLIILNVLVNGNKPNKKLVESIGESVVNSCQIYTRRFNDNIVSEYIASCNEPFKEAIGQQKIGSYPPVPRTVININNNNNNQHPIHRA